MKTYTREQMGIAIIVGALSAMFAIHGEYGFAGIHIGLGIIYLLN